MSSTEELLNELHRKHLGRLPANVTTGKVTEVDTENYTCTVEREDRPPLYEVRLNSVVYSGSRFVVIPAIQSIVLVCIIESDRADQYLLAYSSIDRLQVEIGQNSLEISESEIKMSGVINMTGQISMDGVVDIKETITMEGAIAMAGSPGEAITMNGGELGGTVKVAELKESLTSLKDYSEAIKAAVSSALQQIPNGGAVASMNFNSAMSAKSITIQDVENEDIKQ